MNYKDETMQSITDDIKALILKTQKDLENKTKIINEYLKIIQATKKEYQNLHRENMKLKKNLAKYDNYSKIQQQQQLQQQQLQQQNLL